MALATEQGFSPRRAQADFLQGWLLVEQGDSRAGITQMSMILAGQQGRGVAGRWIAHSAALLAEVLGRSGRISEALNVATEAIIRTQQSGGRFTKPNCTESKGS
jgi:hypothetical protein